MTRGADARQGGARHSGVLGGGARGGR
uniref:Uncharacterized protein n=1 Tax=Arundo donax TaxID=35708 RepID=A0A0A9C0T5_ARUDO